MQIAGERPSLAEMEAEGLLDKKTHTQRPNAWSLGFASLTSSAGKPILRSAPALLREPGSDLLSPGGFPDLQDPGFQRLGLRVECCWGVVDGWEL